MVQKPNNLDMVYLARAEQLGSTVGLDGGVIKSRTPFEFVI